MRQVVQHPMFRPYLLIKASPALQTSTTLAPSLQASTTAAMASANAKSTARQSSACCKPDPAHGLQQSPAAELLTVADLCSGLVLGHDIRLRPGTKKRRCDEHGDLSPWNANPKLPPPLHAHLTGPVGRRSRCRYQTLCSVDSAVCATEEKDCIGEQDAISFVTATIQPTPPRHAIDNLCG